MFGDLKYLVVGSGFFGAVVAERIASVLGQRVLVVEKRGHIGGNSYSETDRLSGVECHTYGSHIFHTSSESVWAYITRFCSFNDYQHKVLTTHKGRVYQMPINLMTLNDFYGLNLKPSEAEGFLCSEIAKEQAGPPRNLEEKAVSHIGRKLYEAFIRGYTQKQWGVAPTQLPADIITRLPVRFNYNANYFSDRYQGIPKDGYGRIFEKLLDHPNIEVLLNRDYRDIRHAVPSGCKVIYTGMVDELYDYCFGPLGWRSLRFETQRLDLADYQGTAVMNYSDEDVAFTRIHEFKHYHPERAEVFRSETTVICREYPVAYSRGMEAYYPVNDAANNERYARYEERVAETPNLILGGRLGAYQYWDMDKAIGHALACFEQKILKG